MRSVSHPASILAAAILAFAMTEKPVNAAEMLEEIVVSAEKKERNALRISGAISTMSADEIKRRRLNALSALSDATPNLDVKYSFGNQNPVVTLRGIGLNDFNANNNSPTGVYTDGGYLPSPYLLGMQLFDIERIEVLRGPQGTLHGRNTTAGAISLFSHKPSDDLSAELTLQTGNYGGIGVDGIFNKPLAKGVSSRFAFSYENTDEGPFRSPNGDRPGAVDRLAGRASFLWSQNNSSLLVQLHGGYDKSDGWHYTHQGTANAASDDFCAPVLAGTHDSAQCFGPDFVAPPGYSDTDGDPFTGEWSQPHRVDNTFFGARVHYHRKLGNLNFTSVTAVERFERFNTEDADVSPAVLLDVTYENDFDVLSQELRLAGEAGAFDWTAGLYASHDLIEAEPNLLIQADELFGTQLDVSWRQKTRTAALFGHSRYALNDRFTVVAGARLNWEARDFQSRTLDLNPFDTSIFVTPGSSGPAVLAQIDDDISDSVLTGRAAVEFAPNDQQLVYVSVGTGYKSGGYTGSFAFADEELAPFKRERVLAYEAGFKASYLDGRLSFDAAAFLYDYTDMQLFTTLVRDGAPVFALTNAADAHSSGLELQTRWQASDVLSIRAHAGLLDTEIEDFRGTPDISGNSLPNAPDTTLGVEAAYSVPMANGWQLDWSVQGAYRSLVFNEVNNLAYLAQGGYTLWNMQTSIERGPLRFSLFAKNLTDKRYFQEGFDQGTIFVNLRMPGAPRTWGIGVTYSYGE